MTQGMAGDRCGSTEEKRQGESGKSQAQISKLVKEGYRMKENRKDRELRLREYRREDLEEMERLFLRQCTR